MFRPEGQKFLSETKEPAHKEKGREFGEAEQDIRTRLLLGPESNTPEAKAEWYQYLERQVAKLDDPVAREELRREIEERRGRFRLEEGS